MLFCSRTGLSTEGSPGVRDAYHDELDAITDQLVEMTKRYLAPDKVDAYLEFARREHGESVAIWLKPEHWLSADLGSI